ncbi:MAG: caspase family protein, partial [Bradyrhizobium guangdongense]
MGALRFFLVLFAIWLGCGPAMAERRVALVIGNSTYKSVPRLTNPANDATLVGGMFKKAGFDAVDVKLDLNVAEMRRALRDFGDKTRDAGVAVIYYAGHGIELDGTNYLIPTDATLERDSDVLDETIALDRALFAVEPAKQLRLIILDACRDNPFAKTMKRTIASR